MTAPGQLPTIDVKRARRIAITAQLLQGNSPGTDIDAVRSTARAINCLQLDPTPVVARNQYLVLWSRLGNYERKLLDQICWDERSMFEFWAHAASLVMTEDWPLHEPTMRLYRRGKAERHLKIQNWVAENKKFRDRMMRAIKREGPLPSRYFTELHKEEWTGGEWYEGWNLGRNVGRMLDCLWVQGYIMVSRREGATRYWDITERVMPDWMPRERLSEPEVLRRSTELSLRSLGLGTERHVGSHYIRRTKWRVGPQLAWLEKQGIAHRIVVERDGVPDTKPWWVHRDYLHLLDGRDVFAGRTTLLSPFDNLICDRDRTQWLWDFLFRLEIYVPPAKRQYGYFVMPILHGDRLVGRVDVAADRKAKVLNAIAVHAEPGAPADAGPGLAGALADLAAFCGADRVAVGKGAPRQWTKALRSLA